MSNAHFRLIPLEFDYQSRGHVQLAEGKTTNILRGALGLELRRQSCPPDCPDSRTCPHPHPPCLYQQLFEGETGTHRPSGYREPPRSFVLRSPDWSQRTLAPGEHLITSLHLFDRRSEILNALLLAYSRMGDAGLGPGRAPLSLFQIRQPGRPTALWTSRQGGPIHPPAAMTMDLSPCETAPQRIKASFLTPTEIKVQGEITRDAAFEPLFARLHERISFLIKYYSDSTTALASDLTLNAARKITTLRQSLRDVGVTRYSTRTGQSHPLEGFVGDAVYEGDFTCLWPWLKASEWTGVGRQTVWGKGAMRWSAEPVPPNDNCP